MVATQNVRDLFVGSSEQQEGYEHTIIGMRIEPMVTKDGAPVQNEAGEQAYGAILYTASGREQRVFDIRLGSFTSRAGALSWITKAGQFVLRTEEVTGKQLQGEVSSGIDRQVSIANAFNSTFAGARVRLQDFPEYYPQVGDKVFDRPLKGTVRMPVRYEGQVETSVLTELQAKAATFIAGRDQKS